MKNIFDIKNVEDISADILSEMKLNKKNKNDEQILELFNIKSPLSLDEIVVGFFRKFGVSKKRIFLRTRVHSMVRAGKLEKSKRKRGVYKLKKFDV